MSKIVDFNKAKRDAELKKLSESSRMAKNQRLAQKRKRYDLGKKLKPIHFYLAIIVVLTIYFLIK